MIQIEIEKPILNCESVSWASTPIMTYGYSTEKYEDVLVETYVKNSKFDSLVKVYQLKIDGKIYNKESQERSFNLPQEITSDFDLKIHIGDEIYLVSNVEAGIWSEPAHHEFKRCKILHFMINSQRKSGSISLRNPSFENKYTNPTCHSL